MVESYEQNKNNNYVGDGLESMPLTYGNKILRNGNKGQKRREIMYTVFG